MVIAPPVASRNELSGTFTVPYAALMACALHVGRLNHVVRMCRAPVKMGEGVVGADSPPGRGAALPTRDWLEEHVGKERPVIGDKPVPIWAAPSL